MMRKDLVKNEAREYAVTMIQDHIDKLLAISSLKLGGNPTTQDVSVDKELKNIRGLLDLYRHEYTEDAPTAVGA